MRLVGVLPLILCFIALVCPSSELTETEARKIDPRLKPLLEGQSPPGNECVRQQLPDGTQGYRVILRGDADELRKEGIQVNAPVGDIMTATLSRDDIIKAAKLPSVRSIECGSTNTIH